MRLPWILLVYVRTHCYILHYFQWFLLWLSSIIIPFVSLLLKSCISVTWNIHLQMVVSCGWWTKSEKMVVLHSKLSCLELSGIYIYIFTQSHLLLLLYPSQPSHRLHLVPWSSGLPSAGYRGLGPTQCHIKTTGNTSLVGGFNPIKKY